MNLLAGVGAVDAVFRGVSGLVREFKRPRAEPEPAFASALKQELARSKSARATTAADRVDNAIRRFVERRDADGSGALSAEESGLGQEVFARLDVNGDGKLTPDEIRLRYMESAAGSKNRASIEG
jgi:hypothetical protein